MLIGGSRGGRSLSGYDTQAHIYYMDGCGTYESFFYYQPDTNCRMRKSGYIYPMVTCVPIRGYGSLYSPTQPEERCSRSAGWTNELHTFDLKKGKEINNEKFSIYDTMLI